MKRLFERIAIAVLDGLTAMVRRANKALDAHAKRKAKDLQQFERGYNWAKGELIRGDATPEQLYNHTEVAQDMGTYNKFDAGIRKACYDWEEAGLKDPA